MASDIFLSCHSQHGPNEHPIKDEHGHRKYVHKKSQSKINHYSKDQDTLILSSDIPVKEPHLAEVNEKTRYNPSLIELKPNVHLSEHDHHPHSHYIPHHGGKHQSHDFHHSEYQTSKLRPYVEMKGFKQPLLTPAHHLEEYEGPSSYSSSSGEYFGASSSQGHSSHEQPQVVSYKPSPPVILVKKPAEVKKVKYITPGLKHYATLKHINRNDYLNFNKNRAPATTLPHDDAVIHYRRNPRTVYAVPRYASGFF